MVKSMYAAIAGLRTHQSKMDVISNNIANVNTWGFKTKSANFEDALYQNIINSSSGDDGTATGANGPSGGTNASQLGYGVNLGSITANYTTGSRGYTGDGYNCMINGTGFFIVAKPNTDITAADETDLTSSGLYLSRVGIFNIDGNGYLVDNLGNIVVGFSPTSVTDANTTFATDALVPIRIPTQTTGGTGERYQLESVSIGTDGVVTGISSTNQKITIGQLAVASVENVNGLEQTSGYLYSMGANVGQVQAIPTVSTTTGDILSGYLEMSNVDLATEMANMITTQRGYQANSKIITVTDEMLADLVNMKR